MRTNIEIDDALMRQAMRASRTETKTKRAVVEEALQELVRMRAQEDIRQLFGKIEFSDGYDYKALRGGLPRRATGKTAARTGAAGGRVKGTRSTRKRAA